MKDRDLRKAFKTLVDRLGGTTNENLYDVGGVYGISRPPDNYSLIYALLNYLNLSVESGTRIVKKKKSKS